MEISQRMTAKNLHPLIKFFTPASPRYRRICEQKQKITHKQLRYFIAVIFHQDLKMVFPNSFFVFLCYRTYCTSCLILNSLLGKYILAVYLWGLPLLLFPYIGLFSLVIFTRLVSSILSSNNPYPEPNKPNSPY